MITILRWMFFIPIALLLGILATFPLHWLIYLSFEKGDLLYEYRDQIEYAVYPFIIGHVFIRSGAYIAPSNNNNVAKGLLLFWIIAVVVCCLVLNTKGYTFTPQTYIAVPLGILGTITAYVIVLAINKEQLALHETLKSKNINDDPDD